MAVNIENIDPTEATNIAWQIVHDTAPRAADGSLIGTPEQITDAVVTARDSLLGYATADLTETPLGDLIGELGRRGYTAASTDVVGRDGPSAHTATPAVTATGSRVQSLSEWAQQPRP